MNSEKFQTELQKILSKAHEKVVALVSQARLENLAQENDNSDSPLDCSFTDNPMIERTIDGFVELGGWIYDRLNGKTRIDKKSMTRKLRKVLGYTGG